MSWFLAHLQPASSSLIAAHPSMPTSNLLPPVIRSGALCPLVIQPKDHPSGPSRVTLISYLHKTFEKSVFKYLLAQSWHFNLWLLLSGGHVPAFFTLAMFQSTWHLFLLDTPGMLQFRNMLALEDNRFLVASHLIFLKSFAINLRLSFSKWF